MRFQPFLSGVLGYMYVEYNGDAHLSEVHHFGDITFPTTGSLICCACEHLDRNEASPRNKCTTTVHAHSLDERFLVHTWWNKAYVCSMDGTLSGSHHHVISGGHTIKNGEKTMTGDHGRVCPLSKCSCRCVASSFGPTGHLRSLDRACVQV